MKVTLNSRDVVDPRIDDMNFQNPSPLYLSFVANVLNLRCSSLSLSLCFFPPKKNIVYPGEHLSKL